jgi:uncharacterized protein
VVQASLFAVLAIILGLGATRLGGAGAIAYGLTPAIAAFGLIVIGSMAGWAPAAGLGLLSGRVRWRIAATAVLVPMMAILAGTVAALGFGEGQIALPEGTSVPAFAVAWIVLVGVGTVAALGEEIGWRGYLLVRLGQVPAGAAGLVMGVLWFAWHLPLILWLGSHQVPLTLPGLALFAALLIGLTIFLNWLRRTTQSTWPAALGHGVHNATWGLVGVAVANRGPGFEYVGPQAGVVPTALYGLVALWLLVGGLRRAKRGSITNRGTITPIAREGRSVAQEC